MFMIKKGLFLTHVSNMAHCHSTCACWDQADRVASPGTCSVIETEGKERWQTMSPLPTFPWSTEPMATLQFHGAGF